VLGEVPRGDLRALKQETRIGGISVVSLGLHEVGRVLKDCRVVCVLLDVPHFQIT
jgi:hypothetical protein